jgi:hypothetical protein
VEVVVPGVVVLLVVVRVMLLVEVDVILELVETTIGGWCCGLIFPD